LIVESLTTSLPRRAAAQQPEPLPPLPKRLRVVLIQIRSQAQAARHEMWCIHESTGLELEQIYWWNLVARPRISWDRLRGADAILIGGSGDHSVTESYPFMPWIEETVRRAVDAGMPLFGICWGHQCLAQALGGRVVEDRLREEIGTHDVELTAAGVADPLLAGLPVSFPAHLVHHCRVVELPPGGVELARNAICPVQVLRIAGKPAYGTQFHGEMNRPQIRRRLLMYKDEYLESLEQVRRVVASLRPTVEARTLLRRFLELYT
jgi:GMP synthase (glutamine-hydrolysing)